MNRSFGEVKLAAMVPVGGLEEIFPPIVRRNWYI